MSKLSVDLLALTGIVWNVAHTAEKHGDDGTSAGLKHGIIILLLAYIIPNLTMEPLIHMVSHAFGIDNSFFKAFIGCIFIGILLVLESFFAELAGVHGDTQTKEHKA